MDTAEASARAVAASLPKEGVTLREFLVRACRLSGDPESLVDETLELMAEDGFTPDDIVIPGERHRRFPLIG